MRLLSRLLIVLAVCLVAIVLPTAPAKANGAFITLSPSSGVPVVEKITIYGYNFTPDKWVEIYYDGTFMDDVMTYGDGYFKITFEVPESCTGPHRVLADEYGSTIYADDDFTVKPGLTVSPEEGPIGTNVTVKGYGFAEDEEDIEVYFDGEMVPKNIPPADEDGSWETSFPIPPSAQGRRRIDAKGDDSSFAQVKDATFEVKPGINILDGPSGNIVDEPSGSPGENITMSGSGFYANDRYIKILFAGEEAETEPEIIRADENGYWEASFKVPEMPTDTYSVTAEGERTPKEDISPRSFELKPGLVLFPDEGHVGTDLTVTGAGFAANKDVVIKYDGSQKATATTNAQGSFSGASFLVPEGIHGPHQVTAEDAAANEATAIFTMEAVPPDTPELTSPADGSRVGFIGKQKPTFEWSEVSDESGVRYRLQIATSANITATGGFVNPKVSVPDIVGTNYTLNATDALPYGTYYWIVQAVDGAENESGWTAARSFQAGLLPLWAFIVIIVAIVAGIGAAVYFFVIRKRIYYY